MDAVANPPEPNAAPAHQAGLLFSRFPLPRFANPQPCPTVGAAPEPAIENPQTGIAQDAPSQTDPELALIARHVDHAYYLASFPNDAAARRDPAAHYHRFGWRVGRDPNPWFDTKYYLNTFADVRSAGIDPLFHYLRNGRAEGRPPHRPGGVRRTLIDTAMSPARRPPGHDAPRGARGLDTEGLTALVAAACLGRRGLVVAMSHDRYIDKTGGVQIFIADEEAQFAADRFAYLHVAPVHAILTLADETPGADDKTGAEGAMPLQLILGGQSIGIALSSEVIAALAALPRALAPLRLFVVHSLFGHRTSVAAALAVAIAPRHRFFWLHDYASLCAGFNLLRNDATYCGAPPEDSMACRICVYGEDRTAYRARVQALFAAVGFEIVAPSRAALDVWRRGAARFPHAGLPQGGLAYISTRVHAHAVLRPLEKTPAREGPIRVAFVGFPAASKGWPLFVDLFLRARATGTFVFYHFANAAALKPMQHLIGVATQVDRNNRLAMAEALAAHDIDLVAVFSPWPETFSFIAHEALAAGADLVALAASGAVAEAIRTRRRGVVLARDADVLHFFLGGHAASYVHAQREAGRIRAALLACGTTATLDPDDPDGGDDGRYGVPDPDRLATDDPDLVVVAGDTVIAPLADGPDLRFDLPAQASEIRLVSRHTTPFRLDPASGDHRRLGIAVRRLTLDGETVPPGDPRRSRGWHGADAGDGVQWTNGDAVVQTGMARLLVIALAPLQRYQRCLLGTDG